MFEITAGDFYRLWTLARAGSEHLYKGRELEFQKEVNADHRLLAKARMCFDLGLTAVFETRQIRKGTTMSDSGMYHPTGDLQGDTKPMPDRGTKTGMNGDEYGADLSTDATNRSGGIGGATGSDPADQCMPSSKGLKG